MAKAYKQIIADVGEMSTKLRAEAPGTMDGFSAMAKAAMAEGALSMGAKELIAMAIAIATRCDGCIGYHAKALVRLKVPRAQVVEMRARVVQAEAEVPKAIAEEFRSGNLGIMDYYRMKNIMADTDMRQSISGVETKKEDKNT